MTTNNDASYTLITGASEGIGKAIAVQCAQRGMNLILVARSENKLNTLCAELSSSYAVNARYFACDLTASGSCHALHTWCTENKLIVNILINNAGMGMFGPFENLDLDKQMSMVDLNVKALVALTHLFVPQMKTMDRAHIMNIASVAGVYPVAYASVYGASKAFVISFTDAIRYELRQSPIRVCCFCPGDTRTEFFEKAELNTSQSMQMDPDTVAQIAVKKMLAGKGKVFPKSMKIVAAIPKKLLTKIIAQTIIDEMPKS